LDLHKHPEAGTVREIVDARAKPRFKIGTDITVYSRTTGTLKGYTVDISESGISAILRMEVALDEIVELDFTVPLGRVTTCAIVRQRSAFRYGFQFLELNLMTEIIRSTCRDLEMEQSLKNNP
jgi:hypothetical protein